MATLKRALLLNDTSLAGNHGGQLVSNQLICLAKQHDIEIAQRFDMSVDLNRLSTRAVDLVLVNGEGSLHDSNKAAKAIAKVPAWAAQRRLYAALINSEYDNNDAQIREGVAQFNLIYTRDKRSFAALQALGVPAKGVVDLAATWQPTSPLAEHRTTVVVTDSSVGKINAALYALSQTLPDAYFLPFKSAPPVHYEKRLASLLSRASFHFRSLSSRVRPRALDRARYRNILPTFPALVEFVCRTAKLVVAGRHHAVCLALDLQIPFVAVRSNTFKVEALLEAVGLAHRLIDLNHDKLSQPELVSTFGTFTDEELRRCSEFRASQRKQAHLMFDEISRACERAAA